MFKRKSSKKKFSMFSFVKKQDNKKSDLFTNVLDGLKKLYKEKLLPLEEHYCFHDFHSPKLEDSDFDATPMILLVGQYSTGKTTFIKFLLEREFPGMRVGPEPTTDRFVAVSYDRHEGMIPGNALVVDPKKQFKPLAKFGNAFLNRFQCSQVDSPVLRNMTIIDTPGVLEWFAERVDRIILLFDAHKLDISDEFRRTIEALRGHDDKIRIVLNKADMIDSTQLLRVYGALMWSLGKVLRYPEVSRVFIGSFWDQPLQYDFHRKLFEEEEQNLFKDLQTLPRNSVMRKLNDLIKRARMARVHAYIIAEIKKDMPFVFWKDSKKAHIIKNLSHVYGKIQRDHMFPIGDFPDIRKMQEILILEDFNKFNGLRKNLIDTVDELLNYDISSLISRLPMEDDSEQIQGGAFDRVTATISPFGFKRGEGIDAGSGEKEWIVYKDKPQYDLIFESLEPIDGKVSPSVAKVELMKSKLPNSVLSKIWMLSDVDNDNMLDDEEFALALHLIKIKSEGNSIPDQLPMHLIPPSRRHMEPLNNNNINTVS